MQINTKLDVGDTIAFSHGFVIRECWVAGIYITYDAFGTDVIEYVLRYKTSENSSSYHEIKVQENQLKKDKRLVYSKSR